MSAEPREPSMVENRVKTSIFVSFLPRNPALVTDFAVLRDANTPCAGVHDARSQRQKRVLQILRNPFRGPISGGARWLKPMTISSPRIEPLRRITIWSPNLTSRKVRSPRQKLRRPK